MRAVAIILLTLLVAGLGTVVFSPGKSGTYATALHFAFIVGIGALIVLLLRTMRDFIQKELDQEMGRTTSSRRTPDSPEDAPSRSTNRRARRGRAPPASDPTADRDEDDTRRDD